MRKLNLGCGYDYLNGWTNLDFDSEYKVDVEWDLNKFPYPFKDNIFGEILCSGILEHLDDFYKVMEELYRISKDKCKIYIMVPHFSDPTQNSEAEHKHRFSYHSFGTPIWNKELYPYFKVLRKRLSFTRYNFPFLNKIINPIINLFPVYYERLLTGFLQMATLNVILEVRKDKEFIDNRNKDIRRFESVKFDNLEFIRFA